MEIRVRRFCRSWIVENERPKIERQIGDEFDDIFKESSSQDGDQSCFEEKLQLKNPAKPILKNRKNQVEKLLEELEKSEFVPEEKPSTATRKAQLNQARKQFPSDLNPVMDLKGDDAPNGELFLLGRRELADLDEEVAISESGSKKIKPIDIYPDDFDSDEDSSTHNPLVVKVTLFSDRILNN